MIRVEIHEERITSYAVQENAPEKVDWKEILKITSNDKAIIAGALRAAADKYDPPQKVHR